MPRHVNLKVDPERLDLGAVHIRQPETECLRTALETALDGSSERHIEKDLLSPDILRRKAMQMRAR